MTIGRYAVVPGRLHLGSLEEYVRVGATTFRWPPDVTRAQRRGDLDSIYMAAGAVGPKGS